MPINNIGVVRTYFGIVACVQNVLAIFLLNVDNSAAAFLAHVWSGLGPAFVLRIEVWVGSAVRTLIAPGNASHLRKHVIHEQSTSKALGRHGHKNRWHSSCFLPLCHVVQDLCSTYIYPRETCIVYACYVRHEYKR